jgi:pyruvate-formate lyase
MSPSPVSRDNYLTLALFSRNVIDGLRDLVESGKRRRQFTDILPEAIESLQAATDGQQQNLRGDALSIVQNYDQVRTIAEVFPRKQDRNRMIKTLKALKTGTVNANKQSAAMEAIHFFYAIENRALRNYRNLSQSSGE